MPINVFGLMVGFAIKHFICDFPLQATPWMYGNKGTYGHIGGITHSVIHGIGTFIAVKLFGIPIGFSIVLAFIDTFIHYHIDWAKMNVNKHFNLGPTTSEWFWILLGIDQLLHSLTYIYLMHAVVNIYH